MANINKNQEQEIVSSESNKTASGSGLFSRWNTIINTCNFPDDLEKPDLISKWLVIIRACVFSMTLTSGLIGGFLAMWAASLTGIDFLNLNWFNFFLATFAIILAHAVNNMLNDYFDFKTGLDDDEYTRAMYAPHPILAGLTTERRLLLVVGLFNVIFIAISLYFAFTVNLYVLLFAALGLFLSIAYVAPPFNFKRRGLGEASVFIVWGPLMIGMTYFVTFGSAPTTWVWLATIPYAITVTTVIIGKHIDKYPADIEKGVHTLPVIIGEKNGRYLNQLLMILFYVVILVMVLDSMLGIGVLLVFLAIPRLITTLKLHNQPKPITPPDNWAVWPLWLVGWSFWHNKLAGGLFVLGLIINLVLPSNWVLLSKILA